MISPCIEPGCSKLCMGLFCIDHDSRPSLEFVHGRPWPPPLRADQTLTPPMPPWRIVPPEPACLPVTPAA